MQREGPTLQNRIRPIKNILLLSFTKISTQESINNNSSSSLKLDSTTFPHSSRLLPSPLVAFISMELHELGKWPTVTSAFLLNAVLLSDHLPGPPWPHLSVSSPCWVLPVLVDCELSALGTVFVPFVTVVPWSFGLPGSPLIQIIITGE